MSENFLNNARKHAVKLLKSTDGGRSWMTVNSFKGIRHIHCVQYDPYEKLLWLGTGDRDEESKIMFSEDEGESWISIGSGSQMFRTISLLFTENYVYWGTDTPARQSYIYRYRRKDGKIEQLAPVSGPVYYSTLLSNGIMFFSTGAEGRSEGISRAWDNKAHIWASIDGERWQSVMSWNKDRWPYILGFGRILFANGKDMNVLAFTTQCLKGVDNKLYICEVDLGSN
ncbi:MAG: WD40/YVTN/BNR-like repeat-containing protein [Promethearchaeota archaeon]